MASSPALIRMEYTRSISGARVGGSSPRTEKSSSRLRSRSSRDTPVWWRPMPLQSSPNSRSVAWFRIVTRRPPVSDEPDGGGMQHAAEDAAVALVAAGYLPEHRRQPPLGSAGGLALGEDGLIEDPAEGRVGEDPAAECGRSPGRSGCPGRTRFTTGAYQRRRLSRSMPLSRMQSASAAEVVQAE